MSGFLSVDVSLEDYLLLECSGVQSSCFEGSLSYSGLNSAFPSLLAEALLKHLESSLEAIFHVLSALSEVPHAGVGAGT